MGIYRPDPVIHCSFGIWSIPFSGSFENFLEPHMLIIKELLRICRIVIRQTASCNHIQLLARNGGFFFTS